MFFISVEDLAVFIDDGETYKIVMADCIEQFFCPLHDRVSVIPERFHNCSRVLMFNGIWAHMAYNGKIDLVVLLSALDNNKGILPHEFYQFNDKVLVPKHLVIITKFRI